MKIEVTELVDPEFDVVTRVPKSSLAMLIKTSCNDN
jgi:amidase